MHESYCSCSQEIETSTHFLLHCSNYHCTRKTLFKTLTKINSTILKQNDQVIRKFLLFGNEKLKYAKNKSILTSTIEFLPRDLKPHLFRVAPRVEKTEVFKKVEILQIRLILRVAKWKNIIFYYGQSKKAFFLNLIFLNQL